MNRKSNIYGQLLMKQVGILLLLILALNGCSVDGTAGSDALRPDVPGTFVLDYEIPDS